MQTLLSLLSSVDMANVQERGGQKKCVADVFGSAGLEAAGCSPCDFSSIHQDK